MKLEQKHGCPLRVKNPETGEMHPCAKLDCAWFMKVEGDDPQDATRKIEEWGCAVTWMVPVTLQVAKDVRQGTDGIQEATESFRNEMSRQNAAVALDPPLLPPLKSEGNLPNNLLQQFNRPEHESE